MGGSRVHGLVIGCWFLHVPQSQAQLKWHTAIGGMAFAYRRFGVTGLSSKCGGAPVIGTCDIYAFEVGRRVPESRDFLVTITETSLTCGVSSMPAIQREVETSGFGRHLGSAARPEGAEHQELSMSGDHPPLSGDGVLGQKTALA